MKKLKIGFLFFILMIPFGFAQNTVRMTSNYGSDNQEIQDLSDFENIYTEQLKFESENLKGKYYQINLEEFKNGKRIKNTMLFDGSETDYFKIKSDHVLLKFFFKLSDGKLKAYIRGEGFGSKKSYFPLISDSDSYTVKNFFGNKKELSVDVQKKIAVFAIITPTIHKDGSGSYCEVVQSEIVPEKLGEHFKIPHYFLITIVFK